MKLGSNQISLSITKL